jgi:hypothetical protein
MTETEALMPMFDSEQPDHAGGLAGEYLASALERHPRYPNLDPLRDASLFRRANDATRATLDKVAKDLPGLGFDEAAITVWKLAALSAFQAALPIRRRPEVSAQTAI